MNAPERADRNEIYHGEKVTVARARSGSDRDLHVAIEGRIDTDNAPAVSKALNTLLDSIGPIDTLVVDLAALRYASSTGIGVFARLAVEMRKRSVTIELVDTHENVKAVFDLLGFSAFFSFRSS